MTMSSAKEVLEKFWDETLPVDPVSIATKMGIAVQADPFLGSESGHYRPEGTEGDRPLIVYNPTEARVRQRFTVAHELGHHVLGHGESPRDTFTNFTLSTRDSKEVEANRFAARLLMPSNAVHASIRVSNITSIEALAKRFNVSKAAMTFRVKNLGYTVK